MSKKKYYVVWKGNNPGVYKSWEKCQDEIKNIKGALFKSFVDIEEAQKAYEMGYDKYKENLDKDNTFNEWEFNFDSAWINDQKQHEYQVIHQLSGKTLLGLSSIIFL